ncbi:MAG: leucine-rich repeat domain-containing protein [Oscillospiraceae bacterium]|nr:leucine-rich repeat domain-containing protein [Oscillospiraceae bacterium]
MKKRIFIILLTLCLAIAAMTVMAMAETVTGIGWELDTSNGELTFSADSSDTMDDWMSKKDSYANQVKSVVFEGDVTEIFSHLLENCSNLTSVTFNSDVTSIGSDAFSGCSSLTSINIPSSVTYIGEDAFYGTKITSVTLSCATAYESDSFPSFPSGCTITISPHNYVNGYCSVCNAVEPDHVYIGSLKLYDGYYTTDGSSGTSGTPASTVTSYAYYSEGVLYLYKFSLTTDDATAISATGDLIIDLCGEESSITSANANTIVATGDITIRNGSLNLTASGDDDDTIYVISISYYDFTVSDCDLITSVTSDYCACGIVAYNVVIENESTVNITVEAASQAVGISCVDLTISASEVDTKATYTGDSAGYSVALDAWNTLTIKDESIVNATADGDRAYDAIFALSDISITGNSTVTAIIDGDAADPVALTSDVGNIEIINSTVIAKATGVTTSGGAIRAAGGWASPQTITITGSTVEATSICTSTTDSTINYGAIFATGDISITESSTVTASTNGGELGSSVDEAGIGILSVGGSILVSASDIEVTIDSSSNYYSQYDWDLAYGIIAIEDISIEEDSNIKIDMTGSYAAGIGVMGDLTISESTINVEADSDSSCGIYGNDIISITASEVVADGGIYMNSSSGTVTVTPATGGSSKITKTNGTDSDISVIDEATVIVTDGYTYVAITAHEHTYDYDNIVWEWAEDYSSVTATATCTDADCDHTETVTATATATVTSVTSGSTVTYTATVEFGGVTYTTTVTKAYGSSTSTASANYTSVREAIAKANALNPDDYEDFSAVTRAITNVDWTLTSTNQSAVNSMAAAINEAIANLVPISTEEVIIDEPVEGTDIEIEV